MKLLLIILMLIPVVAFTQSVGIGTNTPNTSALLDLNSTSKGFLPPKMTSLQRKAILSPVAGLVVYDIDANQLFVYDGTVWQSLSPGSSAGSTATPAQYTQTVDDQKFTGYFGLAVSMSGNYAVVGAPKDDGTVSGSGSVSIYKKAASGGWTFITKLFANDAQAGACFGGSVKMSGNWIVVGAPSHDVSGVADAGKVYIFLKGGGDSWSQNGQFNRASPTTEDKLGYSVAVSATATGCVIVAGCPYSGASDAGSVSLVRNVSGAYTFQTISVPIDVVANDNFGFNLDVDGDYCAIGAPRQTNGGKTKAGAVYIFRYASGAWSQQQKIPGSIANAEFGYSLDLKDTLLIIGAPIAALNASRSEQAVLYKRTGTVWDDIATFFVFTSWNLDLHQFGKGLSIDGNKILIGASSGVAHPVGGAFTTSGGKSAVYLYQKNPNGANYFVSKAINDDNPLPPSSGTMFGNSVSMSNGHYIIGIPGKTVAGYTGTGGIALGYVE